MNKTLSRRTVLRASGVALALPPLASLLPRVARAAGAPAAPRRFVPMYFPNGAGLEWWDIKGTGKAWQPGPLLRPLLPVKAKTLVIRNMGNYSWRRDLLTMSPAWYMSTPRVDLGTLMPAGSFNLPTHSRQPGAMLACVDGDGVRRDMGVDITTSPINAITADQVIAQKLVGKTPINSLQLGLLNGSGAFDGRNSVFSQNMSWSDAKTPMGKELNPQKVFDALVAGGAASTTSTANPDAVAAAAKRKALDLSALDSLRSSISTVQRRLSTADRAQLDQFLTGVRDLEQRLSDVTPPTMSAGCKPIDRPAASTDANQNPVARMQVMNDLIVMALQCDVTRVITYMLDNSRSELVYSHVKRYDYTKDVASTGTAGGYHQAQHAGLRDINFASITNWQVSVAADLAQKMDKISEGDGTLLDHSLLMLFSDMHHGDHAGFDLPMILLGGGGTFRNDECVVLPEDPMMARQYRDLYFTIMNRFFQLGITSFGDDMRKIPNALINELLV
ncbi:MAG TPA: DUF1552 domain-containing protein [Polyangia bacterium]|nr:DUF1552 domain-containing protein [Polyangia bacterium]